MLLIALSGHLGNETKHVSPGKCPGKSRFSKLQLLSICIAQDATKRTVISVFECNMSSADINQFYRTWVLAVLTSVLVL